MAILTDTELVLGLSRHLAAYQSGPEKAALEQLEFAGWIFDMSFRLRGSTTNSPARVTAIGRDVGIGARGLRDVLGSMEALGWVAVQRNNKQEAVAVVETIPAANTLVASCDQVLRVLMVSASDRAALAVLRATSIQPLLRDDALEAASSAEGVTEDPQAAEDAIRYLKYTDLLREVETDDGRVVLYNPKIWTQGDEIVQAALRAADARGTQEVGALLEELADAPGKPESEVTATEKKWIDFAVSQGLVQRSVIQTSDGNERGFLFSPHLGRDPFGGTAGDASGQVRQLVGSMVYATTFAAYKLYDPARFLRALINRGVAGNASSIGTDYPMLEKAGIVKVIGGDQSDRYQLELLQTEVAEDALTLLTSRETANGAYQQSATALQGQRSYVHTDQERAKLALTSERDQAEEMRLISALRDIPVRRSMGNS
ncbi:hypothetical protein [Arthrobacter sp. CAN_A1]|uniref:hypothetical protein n=1 Tax=Arthrobacter sp. CAN_A1 TaxID=2787717 RepID=UPI0018C991E6